MRIRKRQRLRRKEINTYSQGIADALGVDPFRDRDDIDLAEAEEWRLLIADGGGPGILVGDRPLLTVPGLLAYPAKKRWGTVDMGAVEYVYHGAGAMGPPDAGADPHSAPP